MKRILTGPSTRDECNSVTLQPKSDNLARLMTLATIEIRSEVRIFDWLVFQPFSQGIT